MKDGETMSSFPQELQEVFRADVLIIGSGIAGLLSAIQLAEAGASVVLACKGSLSDSNTTYAQGGLAASLPKNRFDSPELHLQDTIASGCGLVDKSVAREIVFSASNLISELTRLGVNFDHEATGSLSLAREGGHHRARILHYKDMTGRSITSTLIDRLIETTKPQQSTVYSAPAIVLEHAFAMSLLQEENHCFGARFDVCGKSISVFAKHTILATGGLGQLYSRTTNPEIATGDGIALAYRIGARLIDMEFVQFHPTALALEGAPAFLISEAVRGAGAILIDGSGSRFMQHFHQDEELATRDVVARAMDTVMRREISSQVYLDLRPISPHLLSTQFPKIIDTLRRFGIDPLSQMVPVSPAAHYFMGGIMTDIHGNTSVSGLMAIGECASVGLHGANRLASNSLLEAGVMALRVASHLTSKGCVAGMTPSFLSRYDQSEAPSIIPSNLAEFKTKMYSNVGLIRDDRGLEEMLAYLSNELPTAKVKGRNQAEGANLALLSLLVSQSALLRRESRGAHYRRDFQEVDDRLFAKRLTVCRSKFDWFNPESGSTATCQPAAQKLAVANN